MTQQEAIEKLNNTFAFDDADKRLVYALEALGLIKFEEEKPKERILSEVIHNARLRNDSTPLSQQGFIAELEAHGYRIVKFGQYVTVEFETGIAHDQVFMGRLKSIKEQT